MKNFPKLVVLLCLVAGLTPGVAPAQAASIAKPISGTHYIYTCPGYSYDPATGRYTLPNDCHGDPFTNYGTHQWLTDRTVHILQGDGYVRSSAFLSSTVRAGRGAGRTHLDMLREGVIRADTQLQGCTAFGRHIGWTVGDHMLNPYRHFGVWSYNARQAAGWQGFLYAGTNGRRTGSCAGAPRVRTSAATMADEFSNRAERDWLRGDTGEAMFNLGVALHVMQDVSVPSHTHPEVNFETADRFPAWANARKDLYTLNSGGIYRLPGESNGVTVQPTAGGWVYWMAGQTHPYFPYVAGTSAVPASHYRCNATEYPEECGTQTSDLLKLAQKASAGFVQSFLEGMDSKD